MFLTYLKESVERLENNATDLTVVKKELEIIKTCLYHIEEESKIDQEVINDLRKQLE